MMQIHRISAALGELDGMSFEHILPYDRPVDENGTKMMVLWDGQMPEQDVYRILSDRQDQWENPTDHYESQLVSCEAWMLLGLKEAGLNYLRVYARKE